MKSEPRNLRNPFSNNRNKSLYRNFSKANVCMLFTFFSLLFGLFGIIYFCYIRSEETSKFKYENIDLDYKIQQIKAQNNDLNLRIKILKVENDKLKKKIETKKKKKADLNSAQKALKKEEKEIKNINNQTLQAEENLLHAQEENDKLTDKIEEYETTIEKQKKEINQLKKKLKNFKRKGEKTQEENNLRDDHDKLSTILSENGVKNLGVFLFGEPKEFRLVYRASQDGLKANKFHLYCDNIGKNVVLIQGENGSIFGGFTNRDWSGSYEDKSDDKAMVFNFSNLRKYKVNNPESAITGRDDLLAVFNKDLVIGGRTVTSNFPNSYGSSDDEHLDLTDGDGKVRIIELEVFEVLD